MCSKTTERLAAEERLRHPLSQKPRATAAAAAAAAAAAVDAAAAAATAAIRDLSLERKKKASGLSPAETRGDKAQKYASSSSSSSKSCCCWCCFCCNACMQVSYAYSRRPTMRNRRNALKINNTTACTQPLKHLGHPQMHAVKEEEKQIHACIHACIKINERNACMQRKEQTYACMQINKRRNACMHACMHACMQRKKKSSMHI